MPPKYSTRRHKYKNKNAKTNKQHKKKRKGLLQRNKRIERPDEVTFNNEERVEFVTGFAKRKQQRRIKAAKDLISIQHQQHIELRKERREEEMEYLVKGGHIKDPLSTFLEEDYNDNSSTDITDDSEDEEDDIMDIEELTNDKNTNGSNEVNYENDDMITTVITSIPSKIDRNIQFMQDAKNLIMGNNKEENDNEGDIDLTSQDSINWVHTKDKYTTEDGGDGQDGNVILSVYEQRKEKKRRIEITESKKKYNKKVKKMLQFVKEFNRKKKRKANAKRSKKKPKKK